LTALSGKEKESVLYNRTLIPADQVTVKVLDRLPRHDTIWDMHMAPDDTLYIGACVEHTAGMSAWLCSYRHDTGKVEYLADMAEVTGESNDSGHATQGKIHFSLCHDNDGLIYGATHCTTAPKGDIRWSPFSMYRDPIRSFPGSYLFVHDPKTRETRSLGILTPNEGIRVMVMDRDRNLLHITTYPKCHYLIYNLQKKTLEDLGRFAHLHQLALFLDRKGNAYTTDSFGRMLRIAADTHRIESLGVQLPHAHFRSGEHNILWQVAKQPGREVIYGATYVRDARMFRYDMESNEMTDLGLAYGRREPLPIPEEVAIGGMTFGKDGSLYYTTAEGREPEDLPRSNPPRPYDPNAPQDVPWRRKSPGHLIRYDIETRGAEDLGIFGPEELPFNGRSCHGTTDSKGNLYFNQSVSTPPRFYIYRPERS